MKDDGYGWARKRSKFRGVLGDIGLELLQTGPLALIAAVDLADVAGLVIGRLAQQATVNALAAELDAAMADT